MHKPSKLGIVAGITLRVVLFTAITTLLAFAIGLFCGISASAIYGAIRHVHPDMTMAYRYVAAPFGAAALVITFIIMIVYEIRRARLASRTS